MECLFLLARPASRNSPLSLFMRSSLTVTGAPSLSLMDTQCANTRLRVLVKHDCNPRGTLACLVTVGKAIYVGTDDDARMLYLSLDGALTRLPCFDAVAGRDTWYAGSAVVNGQVVGPPLGVCSMSATSDGTVVLANVHVGGIQRSTDGGVTWRPTIEVDSDVHEVRAHPSQPRIVIAASAIGLCISRDGGTT